MERNNEAFELLALSKSTSSDESSPNLSVRRKIKRRRSRTGNTYRARADSQKDSRSHANLYLPVLSVFTLGLIGWVLTLTWIAVQLRLEMQNLTTLTNKVSAGNEAIPDAIQKCHNLTKQLEQNQTRIIIELQQVVQKLTEFSGMIQGIETGLSNVKKQLNGSPALSSIPTVQELMANVANFEAQLSDFNNTAMKVTNDQRKISEQIDTINKNLTFYKLLETEIQNWKNSSHNILQSDQNTNETAIQSMLDHITTNISVLNVTMWKKFDNFVLNQSRTQDTINDLKSSIQSLDQKLERLDLQEKVINETRNKTAQLQTNISECKKKVKTNEELLTNLTQQVVSCTCLERNATKDLPTLPPVQGTNSPTKNP